MTSFEAGAVANTGDDVAAKDEAKLVESIGGMRPAVARLTNDESPAALAAAVEFVLEGLHLSKRLNKDASGGRASYRARA